MGKEPGLFVGVEFVGVIGATVCVGDGTPLAVGDATADVLLEAVELAVGTAGEGACEMILLACEMRKATTKRMTNTFFTVS